MLGQKAFFCALTQINTPSYKAPRNIDWRFDVWTTNQRPHCRLIVSDNPWIILSPTQNRNMAFNRPVGLDLQKHCRNTKLFLCAFSQCQCSWLPVEIHRQPTPKQRKIVTRAAFNVQKTVAKLICLTFKYNFELRAVSYQLLGWVWRPWQAYTPVRDDVFYMTLTRGPFRTIFKQK